MKAIRFVLGSFLLVVFFASSSMAQAQRTFVSGLGSDTNPCSRTAPCRTFAQAISQTNAGGEVVVLDSAGYGAFSISHAVSVTAPPGTYAGISVFSGDGVTINAGASDVVILRGLTVNNQGGSNGIHFNTAGTLHVENCVVNGFSFSAGVGFDGPGKLEVKDSIMRGNHTGIALQLSSGTAPAVIDQVRLEGNTEGLFVLDGAQVTVRNSVASGNGTGFDAESRRGGSVELNIENCIASNNASSGILAASTPITITGGAVTVRVSNSIVTDNDTGLLNNGAPAVILSRGNNTVEGNTTNTSGTIGSYSAK